MGGTLFALAHFHAFCLITTTHFTYVFISLVGDMRIVGFASDVVFVFL
jgi:hypothetical protein